jgi:hypothetical protein
MIDESHGPAVAHISASLGYPAKLKLQPMLEFFDLE